MKKHPTYKHIFLWMDILILTAAFLLTIPHCFMYFWDFATHVPYFYVSHFGMYLFFLAVGLLALRFNGAYKRNILTTRYRQFIVIIKSILIADLAIAILMIVFSMRYFYDFGKDQIVYFTIYAAMFFLLFRAVFGKNIFRFLSEKNLIQSNLLIVGADEAGIHSAKTLIKDKLSNFNIVGFADDYKKVGTEIFGTYYNLGKLADLDMILSQHKVDEILVAIDNAPYSRLIQVVETCLETGKLVRVYSNLLRVISEKLDIEFYSSIPVIGLPQTPLDSLPWKDKRIIDVLLSAAAMIVLSPLFLTIMIGIKLSSPGPIFFKQTRIGRNGRPFDFYKFRSMHVNNDDKNHKEFVQDFIKNSNSCSGTDIKVFKITDDPRIFKFGKFIRKTSLDEFPQLFNVLKGDMTLVGPRPCLPYEWDCYEPWHRERLKSLPGCTGIWQTLGRSSVTFEEMVILDLYYISNTSLWLDLKIVLNTFPVIFLGKGAF